MFLFFVCHYGAVFTPCYSCMKILKQDQVSNGPFCSKICYFQMCHEFLVFLLITVYVLFLSVNQEKSRFYYFNDTLAKCCVVWANTIPG